MLTLIDSHCHLDLDQFDSDRDEVVQRARAAGVRVIVNPGIDLQHCRRALALSAQYPEIYVAIGIHPNSSADFGDATLHELRDLAAQPKVVAIGEIGLDYYWKDVAPTQQAVAFRAQLDLAAQLHAPVLGLYGGSDQGIPNDTVEKMREALTRVQLDAPTDVARRRVHVDALHSESCQRRLRLFSIRATAADQ